MIAHAMIGEALVVKRKHAKAAASIDKAFMLAQELSDLVMQAECLLTETGLHLRYGDINAAKVTAQRAYAIAEACHNPPLFKYAKSLLAQTSVYGERERAH